MKIRQSSSARLPRYGPVYVVLRLPSYVVCREHTKEEKLPRTVMENKREIVIHVCDETRYQNS